MPIALAPPTRRTRLDDDKDAASALLALGVRSDESGASAHIPAPVPAPAPTSAPVYLGRVCPNESMFSSAPTKTNDCTYGVPLVNASAVLDEDSERQRSQLDPTPAQPSTTRLGLHTRPLVAFLSRSALWAVLRACPSIREHLCERNSSVLRKEVLEVILRISPLEVLEWVHPKWHHDSEVRKTLCSNGRADLLRACSTMRTCSDAPLADSASLKHRRLSRAERKDRGANGEDQFKWLVRDHLQPAALARASQSIGPIFRLLELDLKKEPGVSQYVASRLQNHSLGTPGGDLVWRLFGSELNGRCTTQTEICKSLVFGRVYIEELMKLSVCDGPRAAAAFLVGCMVQCGGDAVVLTFVRDVGMCVYQRKTLRELLTHLHVEYGVPREACARAVRRVVTAQTAHAYHWVEKASDPKGWLYSVFYEPVRPASELFAPELADLYQWGGAVRCCVDASHGGYTPVVAVATIDSALRAPSEAASPHVLHTAVVSLFVWVVDLAESSPPAANAKLAPLYAELRVWSGKAFARIDCTFPSLVGRSVRDFVRVLGLEPRDDAHADRAEQVSRLLVSHFPTLGNFDARCMAVSRPIAELGAATLVTSVSAIRSNRRAERRSRVHPFLRSPPLAVAGRG